MSVGVSEAGEGQKAECQQAAGHKLSMAEAVCVCVPSEGVSSVRLLLDSAAACCMQGLGRGEGDMAHVRHLTTADADRVLLRSWPPGAIPRQGTCDLTCHS